MFALFLVIFLGMVKVAELSHAPVTWMNVNAVIVPDHERGTDPNVVYDRTVFRSFYGHWMVKVYEIGKKYPVCFGSGSQVFDPEDSLHEPTLSQFIGRACNLKEGSYLLRTTWVLEGDVAIRNTSNVFQVMKTGEISRDGLYFEQANQGRVYTY